MPMRNWDILGHIGLTICFEANIGEEACDWEFNNLFQNA